MVNDPVSVRNAPEKLFVTHFPDLMPPTLITSSRERIMEFRAEHKDLIIKPLFGNGGAGVFHIGPGDENLNALLEMFTELYREPIIVQRYEPAVRDGDNLEARSHMMAVASMGAVAFQKGLGGVHALSHGVGAFYDTHHGLTNAIVMPYVIRANRTAIEDKMEHVGRVLGHGKPGFDRTFEWLMEYREGVGIPNTLAEIDVPDTEAEELGARAIEDPCAAGNPIQHDAGTYADIFRKAHRGDLA